MATDLEEFYKGGPRTFQEAFPPLCIRTHWDPTMIADRILPQAGFRPELAIDPREAFRICTTYYVPDRGSASGPSSLVMPAEEPIPVPPELRGGSQRPMRGHGLFFPVGGAAGIGFPYSGFKSDTESDLLRLDEPLTKCAEGRYMPRKGLPAIGTNSITGIDQRPAMDPELLNTGTLAGCREADDAAAWNRSSRQFFNTTRYDRTIGVPKDLYKPVSQNAVPIPHNTFYK